MSTAISDFRLFLIVVPVISDMLDDDDFPKDLIFKVVHDWTRPAGKESQLSPKDRVTFSVWLRKFARDKTDKYSPQAYQDINAATVDILDRGSSFNPRRSW
jgi:hypothetical protein